MAENSEIAPRDIDTEYILLSRLLDEAIRLKTIKIAYDLELSTDDFYSDKHQAIWSAITELHESKQDVNITSIKEIIEQNRKESAYFDQAGGVYGYIQQCADSCIFDGSTDYQVIFNDINSHIKRLKDIAYRRELVKLGQHANNEHISTEELEAKREAIKYIPEIQPRRVERLNEFRKREKDKTPYIITDGILPAEGYLLIAGQTGEGKSTFAMQMCLSIITGTPFLESEILMSDAHILYLNLENSDYSFDRLIDAQLKEFNPTIQQEQHIIIPDTSNMILDSAKDMSYIQELIKEYHAELVIIDPLMFGTSDDPNDYRSVVKFVKKLKQYGRNANDKEIAWILLHHFNKPTLQKSNPLHRILGSSGWANSATSIITIERYAESRNPFYKQVHFVKTRDAKPREHLILAVNEVTRCFEITEQKDIMPLGIEKIIDILTEKSMSHTDLKLTAISQCRISERTATRLIKKTVESGLIKVNNGLYSIINDTKII